MISTTSCFCPACEVFLPYQRADNARRLEIVLRARGEAFCAMVWIPYSSSTEITLSRNREMRYTTGTMSMGLLLVT